MNNVMFRAAHEGDYPAVAALVQGPQELFRVYPRGSYPLTVAQLRELARVRSDLTVALVNGTVAGFANLYDLVPGQQAFIGNVIVGHSWRGMGLGRALLNHMLAVAFGQYQLPQVKISVFCDNTPALLLYASLGFRPTSLEERRDPQGGRAVLLHMGLNKEQYAGP
ncbi:MAG TPA: GNAT family N-acetyltransferase [Gammaproteobacteria bacterium]